MPGTHGRTSTDLRSAGSHLCTRVRCLAQHSWRVVVSQAALLGVPVPSFGTALSFYDGYRWVLCGCGLATVNGSPIHMGRGVVQCRAERLPANLLQAQRDYFGAHTYERLDTPGKFVHTNWTGRGGNVSSSTYNA